MDFQLKAIHKSWGQPSSEDSEEVLKSHKSSFSELRRMGKARSNRAVTLSQVHKRYNTFEKDYRKLLACVCHSLAIPVNLIQTMAGSEIGRGVSELVANGCTDTAKYLSMFSNQIHYVIGTNIDILQEIIYTSKALQGFSQLQPIQPLALIKLLFRVIRCLEQTTHLEFDTHATKIISWWLPQFVEMLSIFLLISEPNDDGASQQLKDFKTLESFFNCYKANLVIVVYMLTGAYLIDLNLTKRISRLEENPKEMETVCCRNVVEKSKKISDSIRTRLRDSAKTATKQTEGLLNNRKAQSAYQSSFVPALVSQSQIKVWKDVYELLPSICSTSVYLFLLNVPVELRVHLGVDVSEATRQNRNSATNEESKVMLHNLLERVRGIGYVFESIRSIWPITFNESCAKLLLRTTIVISAEAERLQQLDTVPFSVPESWDNWLLYTGLLSDFLDYLLLMIKKEAPRSEVENYLGQMIVQTRFLTQIANIELLEECIFPLHL